jgi:putative phage-type endonuclease
LIWTEEELQQGSAEWHEWRKSGLGASSVACLKYESPYESIQMLWERMMGLRPAKNYSAVMRQGTEKEPLARAWYEREYGLVEPLCVVHPDFPWMRASFDGVRYDRSALVEIKSPGTLAGHKRQIAGGKVPKHRKAQLQYQLEIARAIWGIEENHYVSYWDDKEAKRIVVPYDKEYATDLRERAEIFMGYVARKERPPIDLFRENAPLIAIGE